MIKCMKELSKVINKSWSSGKGVKKLKIHPWMRIIPWFSCGEIRGAALLTEHKTAVDQQVLTG